MRLVLLVAITMVAFAANSILNRLAISGADTGPLAFAAVRLVSGAAMLGALVMAQSGTARLRAGLSLSKAAALGLYMLGFSLAYTRLDAGLGALVMFGGVQITMFAGGMLGGERPGPVRLAGAGIALAGLAWLLWPGGQTVVSPLGAGFMLAAALGWGLYSLMGRGSLDPLGATAGSFLVASVPVGIVAVAVWDGMSVPGALLAVVAGALTSGLGYAMWYRLLPQMPASVAAVTQLTVPPIAIAGGAVLLGEGVGLRFILATVVVLGGVMIAALAGRRRQAA